MGWWIALGILVLLAILPLGVNVRYDCDGAVVRIIAGPIRYTLIPKKKKDKPEKKKKEKASGKTDPQSQQTDSQEPASVPANAEAAPKKKADAKKAAGQPAEKKGGSLLDFLPLVDVALGLLGELFGKTLHVDVLYLKVTMAGGDPYNLALNYGRAWAALGNLWPRLEEWMTIKKRDIRLQCDFEGSETLVNARVDITITLGRLLSLLVRHGLRGLKEFLKIQKKRKGGAKA